MTNSYKQVFTTFNHKLMKLDGQKYDLRLLTKDTYFTRRSKKLSFIDDMKLIISMGPSSIKEEMFDYFGLDINTVSAPGFIESRLKIKEEAFKYLLDYMNKAYPCNKTYKGYRLLAVDGSDITIPTDKNDCLSYENNGDNKKGFNNLHLNSLYDILNNRYLDAIIQNLKEEDERLAMTLMSQRYIGNKAIFIADRGYVSYNLFEHIRNTGNYFLIRVKDIDSKTSLTRRFKSLPSKGVFDEEVSITFTNKQTKEVLNNPNKYIPIMTNQHFDYLDENNHFYETNYRFIRIRIDGEDEQYETIITNLPKDEFTSSDIKELYKLRWCVEVSYKHLKYSVNLNALHSKRRDFIRQEIWARMVMFNISMIIIEEAYKHKFKKKDRKYEYQINITRAIHLIRDSINKRKGGIPPNLLELIAKEILPIRPGRSFERRTRPHSFVNFGYRFN